MKYFCLLVFTMLTHLVYGQLCDNHCLDFDGIDDQISLYPSPINNNADFTIETWFRSTAQEVDTDCANNFRKLVSLNSTTSNFDVGICGGLLSLAWNDNISGDNAQSVSPNLNDGIWHHLAIVKEGDTARLLLDCLPVLIDSVGVFNTDTIRFGEGVSPANPLNNWQGQMDEIRLWGYPRDSVEIATQKSCLLTGEEPGLLANWQLDQGIASANNTFLTLADDLTGNSNDGLLENLTLNTSVSNFICSNAGLIYPNYNLLALEIKNPLQTSLLTEICNDDPIHLCLLYNNTIPQPTGSNTVTWQHNDGAGWIDETHTAFGDFCFVVPPLVVNTDCSINSTGFVERAFRAVVEVRDPNLQDTCFYTTEADTLKICCPITKADVLIQVDTQMCEGDMRTINVSLDSDPFVVNPVTGSLVTIIWDTNGVVIPSLANSTSFAMPIIAGTSDFCVNVSVTNCGGKQRSGTKCISVDPMPQCGTITGMPSPPNLTQDQSNPNLYYICPGDDAAIGIDQPFTNCTPQWEYTFDLTTWQPLGFSNTVQNTNVLPSAFWPTGATAIFYRIACQPLSSPSACEPCYSDTLEIRLQDAPVAVNINGNSPICLGNNSTLTITNPQTDPNFTITYTWLCNGVVVGTGNNYQANQNGCYWVEASNGCQLTTSNQFCLDVCEVEALISCPLMPNECAYQGQSVTLSGCDSQSTCGNTGMSYQWTYNNGTLISTNGCTIEHLPDPIGTTYTLTVTDANGCSATATRFVKPCAP